MIDIIIQSVANGWIIKKGRRTNVFTDNLNFLKFLLEDVGLDNEYKIIPYQEEK